jgi:hypothetical protein
MPTSDGFSTDGDEHRRHRMIEVGDVRMLVADAEAVVPRLRRSGVIERQEPLAWVFVDDIDPGFDFALLGPRAQRHVRLLAGVFVRKAQVLRNEVAVGDGSLGKRRQAALDVCVVEELVAGDLELRDPPLDHF